MNNLLKCCVIYVGASESGMCHLDIVRVAVRGILRLSGSPRADFCFFCTKLSPSLYQVARPHPCTQGAAQPSTGGGPGRAPARPEGRGCSAAGRGGRAAPPAPWSAAPTTPISARDPRAAEGQHEHPCELEVLGGWHRSCPCLWPSLSVTWVSFLALRHFPSLLFRRPPHRALLYPLTHSLDTRVRSLLSL